MSGSPENPSNPSKLAPLLNAINNPDLNPPSISFPGTDKNIALYTSRFGMGILGVTGVAAFTGHEVFRFFRDRSASFVLGARNLTPRENRLIEQGLGAEVFMPVVMPQGQDWPRATKRISHAVETLTTQGKINFPRGQYPGIKRENGKQTVVPITPSQTKYILLNTIARGWPIARMTVVPDALELATRFLIGQGDKDLEIDSRFLLPRMILNINICWPNFQPDQKQMSHRRMTTDFPLGYLPLRFDEQGNVETPPYTVGNTVFHPALMGTEEFAQITSQVLKAQTRNQATVNPQNIIEALGLAANTGGHMKEMLTPHRERMRAIDLLNQFIATMPGELTMALFNTVNIVNLQGQPLPEDTQIAIYSEIAQRVLALGKEKHTNGTTFPSQWREFIQTVQQVFEKHGALAKWGGRHTIIGDLVSHSSSPHELIAFFKEMVNQKQPDTPEEHTQNPTSISLLLASTTAPINLTANVRAQLISREAHAAAAREANNRAILAADSLIRMSEKTTQQTAAFWANAEKHYSRKILRLPQIGAQVGDAAGERTIKTFSGVDMQTLPSQENKIIDADPSSDSKPTPPSKPSLKPRPRSKRPLPPSPKKPDSDDHPRD